MYLSNFNFLYGYWVLTMCIVFMRWWHRNEMNINLCGLNMHFNRNNVLLRSFYHYRNITVSLLRRLLRPTGICRFSHGQLLQEMLCVSIVVNTNVRTLLENRISKIELL